jgi:hypothetical protein
MNDWEHFAFPTVAYLLYLPTTSLVNQSVARYRDKDSP